jgi:hypothetical protein
VAVQDFRFVGTICGGGPVRVQDDGPAHLVDHDVMVMPTEEGAIVEAGLSAAGAGRKVMDLATGGGLVTPARMLPLSTQEAEQASWKTC